MEQGRTIPRSGGLPKWVCNSNPAGRLPVALDTGGNRVDWAAISGLEAGYCARPTARLAELAVAGVAVLAETYPA
jgi:hypothetical protein